MPPADKDRLFDLANDHFERRLDPEQRREFEDWLSRDAAARRLFAELSHDHATLHWEGIAESSDPFDASGTEGLDTLDDLGDYRPRRLPSPWQVFAAAALVALLAFVLVRPAPPQAALHATMASTEAAQWESGDLPTREGARLGSGVLRLAQGLATIRFDSGAEVVLEAPAELEIVDAMRCRLLRGTAVAEVGESAKGFTIATPHAEVVDHGTRFAVNVDPGEGSTRTQVFDGLVEVKLPHSAESVHLGDGQRHRVVDQGPGEVGPAESESAWAPAPKFPPRQGLWHHLDTRSGRGADTYVWGGQPNPHVSEELLLLKHGIEDDGPHRKAYLRFDLAEHPPGSIAEAELSLRFYPTGWGLASHLDDSLFRVYGLTDDALDAWEHGAMDWSNAPANLPLSGDGLDPAASRLLGEFRVPRGVQAGVFRVGGEALRDYLNEDANRLATLVVVRVTRENRSGGLVHAFASARHPYLPGPVLSIRRE